MGAKKKNKLFFMHDDDINEKNGTYVGRNNKTNDELSYFPTSFRGAYMTINIHKTKNCVIKASKLNPEARPLVYGLDVYND